MQRLRRVFDVDLSQCPHCGGQLRVIAQGSPSPISSLASSNTARRDRAMRVTLAHRRCGSPADPTAPGTYPSAPARMLNAAWLWARKKAGLPQVRVHDLKHTYGRRLRAAGVSFEDRQDLLGHRSGRITTHYSAAELSRLIDAANSVCDAGEGKPQLVVLRRLSVS